MNDRMLHELGEAERKAWQSLGRYKFQMFGYWAAIWVHLNRIGEFKRANPFSGLVRTARASSLGEDFLHWAIGTFGAVASDREERALRFVEEAIELAHAEGIAAVTLGKIIERVYARPPGNASQELGQAEACLQMFAASTDRSALGLAEAEFERVQGIPPEQWKARHKAKVDMGIAK